MASPDEIIAAAVEQKMPAVALTDTHGMYAAVSFYNKAHEAGIKPIVGVTLDVEFRISSDEFRNPKRETRNSAIQMTLLAANMEGYSNLCQLVTLRHLGTTKLDCLPVSAADAAVAIAAPHMRVAPEEAYLCQRPLERPLQIVQRGRSLYQPRAYTVCELLIAGRPANEGGEVDDIALAIG